MLVCVVRMVLADNADHRTSWSGGQSQRNEDQEKQFDETYISHLDLVRGRSRSRGGVFLRRQRYCWRRVF
jgi:hypothetical protein